MNRNVGSVDYKKKQSNQLLREGRQLHKIDNDIAKQNQ